MVYGMYCRSLRSSGRYDMHWLLLARARASRGLEALQLPPGGQGQDRGLGALQLLLEAKVLPAIYIYLVLVRLTNKMEFSPTARMAPLRLESAVRLGPMTLVTSLWRHALC